MKLTRQGINTFIILLFGSAVILTLSLLLTHQLLLGSLHPRPAIGLYKKLDRLITRLPRLSSEKQEKLIRKLSGRGLELSLSKTPLFKPIPGVLSHSDAHRQLVAKVKQFSLQIAETRWLNVDIKMGSKSRHRLLLSLILLAILCLGALATLYLWAVIRLNAPLRRLSENLDYAKHQKQWNPLPLVGPPEQRLMFEKINALQENIQRLLQARTRMIAAISHDLRTPLTRIRLRADMFQDPEHQDKLLADIDEMDNMIGETLEYLHEIDHQEPEQDFDLVALLTAISEDAEDLGHRVQCHTQEQAIIYHGRYNLLKRALCNLLQNGIKYGHEVRIKMEHNGDKIQIIFDDQGPGIKQDSLETVFEPYHRLESSRSRQTGGTGLGLGISREIIEMHHGTVELINRPQGGLRVSVVL